MTTFTTYNATEAITWQRPCPWCGRQTTGTTCKDCRGLDKGVEPSPYNHGLYGGRWVNRGSIQVWEQR